MRGMAVGRPASTRLYVGTYTHAAGGENGSKGIYTCTWDPAKGELGPMEVAAETPDPTFLAMSPAMPELFFAVNELGTGDGKVSAFRRKGAALDPLNVVGSGGNGPCHLALDRTGKALFVANYGGGSVSSYQVSGAGVSEPVATIPFSGHSVDPDRQAAAHTHCVLLSPDNRFLLVNDLGLDRIMVYGVDPVTAKLTPAAEPYFSAKPGAGPRHSIFHPNGRWVYSVNELGSTIDQLAWDKAAGGLKQGQTVSTLPAASVGEKNSPAELAIDGKGKFLYVSNRFHDSIGVFAIDGKTGALKWVQDVPSGGKVPRHFALDPTEKWVLVGHQETGNVVVFARDGRTGMLTATGRSYPCVGAVCLVFASA